VIAPVILGLMHVTLGRLSHFTNLNHIGKGEKLPLLRRCQSR
jgi:hypothetical protein